MTQHYNILCLDGGGIRGLITALLLQNLPSTAVSNANLFAGTSTGGIISIALASGIDVAKIVDLYSNQCSSIFNPKDSPAASVDQMTAYITAILPTDLQWAAGLLAAACKANVLPINLFSAKYSNASLQTQIRNVLGDKAGTSVRKAANPLFVTTFQLDRNSQWTPISLDNLPWSTTPEDVTLLDAALCTSAAPTYFPPYQQSSLGYCIDGGTFANNPSTFVLARALKAGIQADRIRMLSIGTGATQSAVPPSYFAETVPAELWGTYQYMIPLTPPPSVPSELLISLMMDGSSEIDDLQTTSVLKGNYLRVEVPLTQPVTLDDCNEVPTLKTLANQFVQQPAWATIKKWVTENFV